MIKRFSKAFSHDIINNHIRATIMSLSDDSNYKVRKEVINILPSIIINKRMFNDHFKNIYFTMCDDPIWSVRKECISICPKIVKFMTIDDA